MPASRTAVLESWAHSMAKPGWSTIIDWLLEGLLAVLCVLLVLTRLFYR
jgi:hypothetical protein